MKVTFVKIKLYTVGMDKHLGVNYKGMDKHLTVLSGDNSELLMLKVLLKSKLVLECLHLSFEVMEPICLKTGFGFGYVSDHSSLIVCAAAYFWVRGVAHWT